jgi:hypothetical protein
MNCWSGLLDELEADELEVLEPDVLLLGLAAEDELSLDAAAGWPELLSEVAALLELLQPIARNPHSRRAKKKLLVISLNPFIGGASQFWM